MIRQSHCLAVLHSHHEDDADGHQCQAGQDGGEDDEDRSDNKVCLAAGVCHNVLGLGLLQGEGMEGGRLADSLHNYILLEPGGGGGVSN